MATGTPATAMLTARGIAYTLHAYAHDARAESYGAEAAAALSVAPSRLFKTLVARLDGRLVCAVVPVAGTLSLKALARFETVFVSAGRRGLQVELAPGDLLQVTDGQLAPIAAR
jgi:Cys-tRNA(Pro)/Cys-tRNA(Cys) deacylase